MTMEDILKEKKEIMDMIYNVGWIFMVIPALMQAIPWIFLLYIETTGFEGKIIAPGVSGVGSMMMSGFVTMIYMTYKMMNLKDISLVSLLRVLAKLFLKRFS